MDFTLSDEHEELRSTLRTFFEKEAPTHVVAEIDQNAIYPAELYAKVAELGLCGITISEEYGGSAADEFSICIVAEEMARASGSLAYAFIPTVTFCAKGIQKFGSPDQKKSLLPEIAAGRLRIAMGLSEPDAGSDLAGLATKAVRDGEEFVISGQKIFTTGADTADYIFCFARTDPEAHASKALSVLLVPTDAQGVTINTLQKLSGQGTHTCEVFLDDVRVPESSVVGELGDGLPIIFELLDGERIIVGAQGCGIGQGALDKALRHAAEREQFGKPIADFQAIGHMLADMAIDIEMARLITYKAAWKKQNGLPCSMEASMAKVAGSEAGSRCATRGMQILGGYSYMVEYGMERLYRETKLNEIAGGSNQIQRNIILKNLRRSL
ncbi:MAG: acyl-CoA dehydrogenase family protein [Microthrixaceae bacterium]